MPNDRIPMMVLAFIFFGLMVFECALCYSQQMVVGAALSFLASLFFLAIGLALCCIEDL